LPEDEDGLVGVVVVVEGFAGVEGAERTVIEVVREMGTEEFRR
jgi:hypothetical protein